MTDFDILIDLVLTHAGCSGTMAQN